MQHEGILIGTFQRINQRRITQGAKRRNYEGLGFATGKQRRAVSLRQHANFYFNGPHGAQITAVDTRLAIQHALTNQVLFDPAKGIGDVVCTVSRVVGSQLLDGFLPQCRHCGLSLHLVRDAIRLAKIRLDG